MYPAQPIPISEKELLTQVKKRRLTLLWQIPKQRSKLFIRSRCETDRYLDASECRKYEGSTAGGATVFLARNGSRYIPPGELYRPSARVYARIGQILQLNCLESNLDSTPNNANSRRNNTCGAHMSLNRFCCLQVDRIRHAMGDDCCLQRNQRLAVHESLFDFRMKVDGQPPLERGNQTSREVPHRV